MMSIVTGDRGHRGAAERPVAATKMIEIYADAVDLRHQLGEVIVDMKVARQDVLVTQRD